MAAQRTQSCQVNGSAEAGAYKNRTTARLALTLHPLPRAARERERPTAGRAEGEGTDTITIFLLASGGRRRAWPPWRQSGPPDRWKDASESGHGWFFGPHPDRRRFSRGWCSKGYESRPAAGRSDGARDPNGVKTPLVLFSSIGEL